RLYDGACAHWPWQEGKSLRGRWQASPVSNCRRSLDTLVDKSQPRHASSNQQRRKSGAQGGGLRSLVSRARSSTSRVALPALSGCQARLGGERSDGVRCDDGLGIARGQAGVDAWFSGINTSTEALEAIKSGRLTSLAGGHFITGAWALLMIYDYHHGCDFADEGLELRRSMFAEFTPQLADRYLERFSGGFEGVDFSRYSKVKNPKLKRYNFGFSQLLEPQS